MFVIVMRRVWKVDWVDRLSPGDSVYFKNFRPTDIRRWLLTSFVRRVSPNTFQVFLASRTYLAHRNQLKEAPKEDRRRKCVFTARSERRGTKRGRERYGDADYEDGDDSFYGFAADSSIFADDSHAMDVDVDLEVDSERESAREVSSNRQSSAADLQFHHDPVEGTSSRRLPDYSVPSLVNRPVLRRTAHEKIQKGFEFFLILE